MKPIALRPRRRPASWPSPASAAAARLGGHARRAARRIPSSGPAITLGDLFDGAGPAARVVVGNGAPAGLNAVLDAGQVQQTRPHHGLDWANPTGIRRIIVPRRRRHAGPAPASAARPSRS